MASPSKREKILETASNLFIRHGFQGVSVEHIAAAVPVSKPTLYAHFKDKRDLFAAVVAARCQGALTALKQGIEQDIDLKKGLHDFGEQFLELLLDPSSLQFHRVMVAESESFPEMAQMFYETGPKQMQALLRDFLQKARKDENISISDPGLSADIFIGMLKGGMHLKCMLGMKKATRKEREDLISTAVNIFLNGHRS